MESNDRYKNSYADQITKGASLYSAGRYENALKYFDSALEIKPDCVEALINKGTTLLSLDKYEDAIKCYKTVLEINPDNTSVLCNLGISLASLGRHDEATKYYDKLTLSNPGESPDMLYNKGVSFEDRDMPEKAIEYYSKVLCLDPDHISALNNKGNILASIGKIKESLKCFEKIIEFLQDYYSIKLYKYPKPQKKSLSKSTDNQQ